MRLHRWIVDNEPSERYPIYTRANAGEVYPDPMTPLSTTLVFDRAEDGWRDAYLRYSMHEHEFDLTKPEIIGRFGGYLYLNMSLTRLFGVRMPGMTPEMVDFQYFGEMPGIPPYEAEPWHEDDGRAAALEGWVQEAFTMEALPELDDDRALVDAIVEARPHLDRLDDRALVEHLRALVRPFRPLFDRHITISAASGVMVGTVAQICQTVGEPELTMTLVAGIGDVDSAAPSYAMWDLSRLDPDRDEFRRGFADFQERFGSRGPNEWELRSPTWGTDAALPLAAIDAMRSAPDDASPVRHQADREDTADKEASRVAGLLEDDPAALAQFRAGVRGARVYLAGRERSKTTIIALVHEMRLAARELGRRLVEAGHLATIEQVFMLTDRELDEAIAYPHAFRELVEEREREYLELFELEPPFIVVGHVPPLRSWARRRDVAVERAGEGTVLSGIPGCPGRARGRARVVLDPADPTALEPGDVLVAPITDPAWTPLFVPAAAVVVDVGAQVSHAVIVSRELGIPCVVSVTSATKKIPDGALIDVDGTTGTVTVVGTV